MKERSRKTGRQILITAIGLAVVLGCLGTSLASAGDVPKRLKREMAFMEDLLSDVLVESPYWLVSSGGPTSAFYLDGFGVILNMQASLVGGSRNFDFGGIKIFGRRLSSHVWDWDDDDDYYYDDDDEDEDEDWDEDKAYSRWSKRRRARAEKCYTRGKEELQEYLLECGDLVEQLGDNDWVAITARLKDHRYFRKIKTSHLMIRAKAGDLRNYASGGMDDDQMMDRMEIEEY